METLKRHENFFNLFTNFNQFPFPKTIEEYNLYKKNSINFCKKRNKRTANYFNNFK